MGKSLALKLRLWTRLLRKKWMISQEEKSRGGADRRWIARLHRRYRIYQEKQRVINDLYRSWKLGEVRSPKKEHLELIESRHQSLPWQILREIKNYYWE
jgi:hypothetical protein